MPSSKKAIDPLEIFLHAHSYFQAQELIYAHIDGDEAALQAYAFPTTTLAALACELFLKCLVAIETGHVPRGHNLKKLFDQLSRRTRERLEELWVPYAEYRKAHWDYVEQRADIVVARDLPSALSAGSRVFEIIRYRYEDTGEDYRFYLDDLPHMLGKVALELKPEWEQIVPAQPTPRRPLQPYRG
jgi:HEPN domain-containing protein